MNENEIKSHPQSEAQVYSVMAIIYLPIHSPFYYTLLDGSFHKDHSFQL